MFSWRLLKSGGVMMIDDYIWLLNVASPMDIPYYAVNHFLSVYEGQYVILYQEYRLCLQKC
jgi:hypothetical protein